MITDDEVPLDPAQYPLVAYVHYRAAGGLILTIVNHAEGVDDSGRREFLLVLDGRGWRDVTLQQRPDREAFPGFVLGCKLPVYGYQRDRRAFDLINNCAGWVRTAAAPSVGRAIPVPHNSPVWKLPVQRLEGGGYGPGGERCTCTRETPPRSYCRLCPPGYQESAYLYAIQAPPGGPGISGLRSGH